MAIYFLNLKTFGRSTGSSAVSAAAYRAGERLRDERTGRTYDHSDRQDVLHKEIMLPNQFAAAEVLWAKDRGNLWNTAEQVEARSNARTAREYLVALPAELSPQARIDLVVGFSRGLVERYRFALDIAIHAPRAYPGSDPRNFHAHLLATTREVTPAGLGAKTTLEWSDTNRRRMGLGPAVGELLHVRERWAVAANAALEKEHINAHIDHRTLHAQGIDREPKPHIPRAAFEMERHGYRSVVAERIRAEHQARVEARLQRASQNEKAMAAPKSLKDKVKEAAQRWLRHRQAQKDAPPRSLRDTAREAAQRSARYRPAQEAQPKSPKDIAKESAQRSAQHRQAQKETQPKSSQDEAKESALKWKARYGQKQDTQDLARLSALRWAARYGQAQDVQAQAQVQGQKRGQVQGQKQSLEQEQKAPASPSAKRTRQIDFDRSL